MKGKVKKWDDAKGYGFITPDGGGKDVFVHHTGIIGKGRKNLNVGQEVTFTVESSPKGPQAAGVVVISG